MREEEVGQGRGERLLGVALGGREQQVRAEAEARRSRSMVLTSIQGIERTGFSRTAGRL
jgi:hypothetical protein